MVSIQADAEALRKAMKGFGTDEETIIKIICHRTIPQIQEIRNAFKKLYDRDLISDLRSELTGDLEHCLAGLTYVPTEYDAYMLNKAVKGMGTDEDLLTELLSHRDAAEMQQINAYYLQLWGKTLEHDLKGDLSGDLQHLFISLAQGRRDALLGEAGLEADSITLYEAGEGRLGTKEGPFCDVLSQRSAAYLAKLNTHYAMKNGHTVAKAIEKEFGGKLGDALSAIMEPNDDYYAKKIHAACRGMGTKEKDMMRNLISRRAYLPGINAAYMRLFGKTIQLEVDQEFNGKLQTALLAVMNSPAL